MRVFIRPALLTAKNSANHYRVTTDNGYESAEYAVYTNAKGDGLWIDGKQVEGTSQFTVRGVDARDKLRRYFMARA